MNRLGFADFHSKHFGADQKAYWQAMLKQQQQVSYCQQHDIDQRQAHEWDQHQGYYTDQQQEYDANQQQEYYTGQEEQHETGQHDDTEVQDSYSHLHIDDEFRHEELSKEVIEIFRFSEAYRKERAEERLKEETFDEEGMDDWQYDESSVLISGGLEAPASSLVLTNKKRDRSTKIMIQEELLNSAYLQSCTDAVLWPVLPFKM